MRVLAVLRDFPSQTNPQAGVFMRRRLEAMMRLGHTVEVVRIVPLAPALGSKWSAYRAVPDREIVGDIPVHAVRAIMPPRLIGMETVAAQVHRRLAAHIDRFRPDVLHASFVIPCGHAAIRHSVPVVVSAHGVDTYGWPFARAGLQRAARETLRKATRLSAVSGFLGNIMRTLCGRDVRVIWNGADERTFFPRAAQPSRDRLAIPEDRFTVVYAGNLLRAKGLFELIDAAAMISEYRPLVCLAGEGPDKELLQQRAAQRNVDVRFLGRREHAEIADVLAAADVVTLPSYAEGLPNIVCEAMLSGRAVVASTAGGIPEIVDDGATGLLVAPKDAPALASALSRLAADANLRSRLAAQAHTFAARRLTWEAASREYEGLYHETIEAFAA
ncbi:MAG TPA: glycosyltransferase [Candidatus Baltobacteraceae bacterium]|jgi:glycosyltransferase involved in cell wall biosynthesis|nr:glycosyltransferase [Candidatus Baltobacteraceae bacterium]